MEQDKPELCTLRIVFPVVSDEQAIGAKKRIAESLKDVEGVQIHFSLMTTPPQGLRPNVNAQRLD